MLKDYLPPRLLQVPEIAAFQDALQPSTDMAAYDKGDLFNQLFISTATWGLSLWERQYGLSDNERKPIDQRRAELLSKIASSKTATKQAVAAVVFNVTGTMPDIVEKANDYSVVVLYKTNVEFDKPALIAHLKTLSPAHIQIDVQYKYLTVGEVGRFTIAQLQRNKLNEFAFGGR